MLNYTLDPYQRQYSPEAAETLWEVLLQTHVHAADPSAPSPKLLPPGLAPVPAEEQESAHDCGVALLGCIVAIYQSLSDVFHTAVGVELASNEGLPLPDKPTPVAMVRDVGRQVDKLVWDAVAKNAWQLLYYGSLRSLLQQAGQGKADPANRVPPPPAQLALQRGFGTA